MPADHWLSCSGGDFELPAAAVAAGDPAHILKLGLPTSSARAAASIPSRRANSTAPGHSSSAAVMALRAYFAIPQIVGAPALRHPDKALFRVPGHRPPALGTPYQLAQTVVGNGLPETHRLLHR